MKTHRIDTAGKCPLMSGVAQGHVMRRNRRKISAWLPALAVVGWMGTNGGQLLAQAMEEKAGSYRPTAAGAMSTQDWWPNQVNLKILHQNSAKSDPLGQEFSYAEEFKKLDLDALKSDIKELMLASQD